MKAQIPNNMSIVSYISHIPQHDIANDLGPYINISVVIVIVVVMSIDGILLAAVFFVIVTAVIGGWNLPVRPVPSSAAAPGAKASNGRVKQEARGTAETVAVL